MNRALSLRPPLRGCLAAVVCALPLLAAATPAGATQTINGDELRIFVHQDSRLQAKQRLNPRGVFYPPGGFDSNGNPTGAADGNSGFFIGSPVVQGVLEMNDRFGPSFPFGPSITNPWITVSEGPVTGTGTQADPFTQQMVYKGREDVDGGSPVDQFLVTQTVRYVKGTTFFDVQYDVKNVSGEARRFRATTAADLHGGDDFGFGSFTAGPPRVVLGHNEANGYIGGLVERTPAWTNYQEGSFRTAIFDPIQSPSGAGYTDLINTQRVDYGIGAEWDDHYTEATALANNATATYNSRWTFSFNPPGGPAPGPTPGTQPGSSQPPPGNTTNSAFTPADLAFIQTVLQILGTEVTQNPLDVVLRQRGFGLFFPTGNRLGFLQVGLDASGRAIGSSATASAKKKRKRRPKRIRVAAGSHRFTSAGAVRVKIPLTRKGVALLKAAKRRGRKVRLRMRVTFTPNGGKAVARTDNATLKPKSRRKRRRK